MKTSNKFLLTAVLLLIVSVGIYDFQLKAEYLKGEYKNPYNGFSSLNFKNFKIIDLGSSTAINIMLEKGPFKVLAAPQAMEFMKIEQRHDSLFIRAVFKDNFHNVQPPNVLYISLPQLDAFYADAKYKAGDAQIIDTVAAQDFNWRVTTISGFSGNKLDIIQDHASTVLLKNNKFNILNAIIGKSGSSASNLSIETGNQFGKTNLDIRNKSRLWIKDDSLSNISYKLADSAKLILNGNTRKIRNNK
ncbi:hypothetical protein SAMN05192574_104439 [Mucilaginibacter gossypiicola]|uniref:Uncharacterized protein n=1 Tax=Mucilaginibacter gossypiicola TaxID=551995 RepID=A0A1H8K417_9SPHI|nr:hypothetical protein [Mucilaginibacter gossypiicola]SEN87511.1 hypothetical protein SAMN05192574_104439 [Mucilaginibacter gossypiicola]